MDMADEQKISWRSVLSTVLWILLAVGGLTLIQPLMVIFFAIGLAMGSGEATAVTMDKYRIVSARDFGLLGYGVVWLTGVIFLQAWLGKSKTVKQMFARSGIVLAGEAAVWGIGALVQELVMS